MTSEKNRLIAIFTCKIHDDTIGEIVNDICDEANEMGYKTIIYNSFYDFYQNNKVNRSSKNIFTFPDYMVPMGIIILGETFLEDGNHIINEIAESGFKAGIPVVSVDKEIDGASCVMFDYSTAFESIVRHIVEYHGCKRVNFLGGFKNNRFSEERLDVYKKVLNENNIPIEDFRIGYGDFWDLPAAKAVNEFLAAEDNPPEAIICANDSMAITACRILEEHGYVVPDDVIVTGFDGIEQQKYHIPRFTTAFTNYKRAAKSAVGIIKGFYENGSYSPQDIKIPYDVEFSQSCGCKPVVYKRNVNNYVMDLYNRLYQQNELAISMNSMNNIFTACSSVIEALPKIDKYIGVLYTDAIFINLRSSFLSNNDADYSKPINCGEKMLTAIAFIANVPKIIMREFSFGEIPPYTQYVNGEKLAILMIPLNHQDEIYGFVSIYYNPRSLQFDKLFMFSMNLNHSLDTVKSKELMLTVNKKLEISNSKLESAYAHDSMTGLLNRRGFYREMMERIDDFKSGYVFVASVDLDGLKYINDNFGHQEGDFAIKQIASAIVECSGKNGICARFGGDEFMSLIFSDRKDDSVFTEFRSHMDKKIEEINEQYTKKYRIDASIGTEISAIYDDIDLDSIMRVADEKMYENKSSRGVKIRKSKRYDKES